MACFVRNKTLAEFSAVSCNDSCVISVRVWRVSFEIVFPNLLVPRWLMRVTTRSGVRLKARRIKKNFH